MGYAYSWVRANESKGHQTLLELNWKVVHIDKGVKVEQLESQNEAIAEEA
jgi:hypothetical protein